MTTNATTPRPLFLPPDYKKVIRGLVSEADEFLSMRLAGAPTEELEPRAIMLKDNCRRIRGFISGIIPESALRRPQS
jgi:hypothetical protein